jgi:hypothetical protein
LLSITFEINPIKKMQKIDFVANLEIIATKLKSREILAEFNSGFNNPGNAHNYAKINPLLFLSKSNFDHLINEPQIAEILTTLNAPVIYSENNLSDLTTKL